METKQITLSTAKGYSLLRRKKGRDEYRCRRLRVTNKKKDYLGEGM